MMSVMMIRQMQKRLNAMGFDAGNADGIVGPRTIRAVNSALDKLAVSPAPPVVPEKPIAKATVPQSWMPAADMKRIVFHWTAGSNKAGKTDKEHYHILIEGDGKLVRGDPTIDLNEGPVKKGYAAHTLNLNSGSIGVSLCGMAGAKESPFNAGKYPITKTQWDVLADVLADLSREYGIAVTKETILSHAEVQPTLGVKQRQKWDISRLPWDASLTGPISIGNEMRAMVKTRL